MKKYLKEQWTRIKRSESFRLAITAIISAVLFKFADLAFGFLPALIAVSLVAVAYPFWIRYQKRAWYNHIRNEALLAIQEFYEAASFERTWSNIPRRNAEAEIFYAPARRKALEIHEQLVIRARHLDRCVENNLQVYPGASWNQLKRIAKRMEQLVGSANYATEQGLYGANYGLLDPAWKLEETIHTGDPKLEAEPVAIKPERVIVPMTDYKALRKNRGKPDGNCQVFVFSGTGTKGS